MKRSVKVFIGEKPTLAGNLYYNQQGNREMAAFEYDTTWLAAKDRFTLDPTLPLVTGPQFYRKSNDGSVFQGIIADAEPDGWGRRVILRDHAKRRKSTIKTSRSTEKSPPLTSLDFLLSVDDFSRVGALRFQDENGFFQRAKEEGRRTAPPLIELRDLFAASRAVELNQETAADLAYLRGRGTSLGGLRPKCSVVDERNHLAIGKFPSVQDDRAVTKGEVLTMQLARIAGINVPDTRLIDSEGIPVALIRRFDRPEQGGRLTYVSAATLLGVAANDPTEHTYMEIVDAIRANGAAVQSDIEEIWRRVAFFILVTNVDDHLCNHGFLHATGEQWRLSPAFDINPFPDRVRELKTWISDETGPEASIEALMTITKYCRIGNERAKEILRQVEAAVAKWRVVGKRLGMTKDELDSFAAAFEHPERATAKRIAG